MAAMGSLEQRAPERAEIPRFDDSMVNIQEFIGIMAESLINETMDAQAEEPIALAAAPMRVRAPTPSYDGTAGEHTTRATEAVVAATRSGRRAAQMMG